MTPDEARELIVDGINYAAYKETESSLHDSDKNRLFRLGSQSYPTLKPAPVSSTSRCIRRQGGAGIYACV